MHLIADIGGTNLRIALAEGSGYTHLRTLQLADYAGLEDALQAYVNDVGARPASAALAVAAPCANDRITFTNADWSFSKRKLQDALGLNQLSVINDFEAQALALPLLTSDQLEPVGPDREPITGPKVTLGPGTGLGVAGLVAHQGSWVPVATEGGHVSLAGANAREDAVIAQMREEYGHCSAERLLCGPGLLLLYQTLAWLDGKTVKLDSPAAITQAMDIDPLAGETMTLFFALLGSVAGNLALSYGASGGVYLTGGILPRLTQALLDSDFRRRFTAKGRYHDYLDAIPTWLITAEHPALLGLCAPGEH